MHECFVCAHTNTYVRIMHTHGNIYVRIPAQVRRVSKEDACPGHCGRRGSLQMTDLKHEPHGRSEGHTLVACKSQHLMCVRNTCAYVHVCAYVYVCVCACVCT